MRNNLLCFSTKMDYTILLLLFRHTLIQNTTNSSNSVDISVTHHVLNIYVYLYFLLQHSWKEFPKLEGKITIIYI